MIIVENQAQAIYLIYKIELIFQTLPKIINNGKNPNQYWTFYTNKKFDDKYVFVLSNYKNKEILENLLDKYKIIHNHKDDCLLLKKK